MVGISTQVGGIHQIRQPHACIIVNNKYSNVYTWPNVTVATCAQMEINKAILEENEASDEDDDREYDEEEDEEEEQAPTEEREAEAVVVGAASAQLLRAPGTGRQDKYSKIPGN